MQTALHQGLGLAFADELDRFRRRIVAVRRLLQRKARYVELRPLGDVANAIGKPAACRAVGAANGANPLPIVVPCHRVIGANGSLTGFGGGIDVKRRLLALEGALSLELTK